LQALLQNGHPVYHQLVGLHESIQQIVHLDQQSLKVRIRCVDCILKD
jgi:hypothetical protein